MALPNPTSIVSIGANITLSDIVGNTPFLNRVVPAVVFKALNVQYQGYVSIPISTNVTLQPSLPVTSFAVAYIRNIGGTGTGNLTVSLAAVGGANGTVVNLDVGAIFLYISPQLSSVVVNGIQPGLTTVQLLSAATTSSNAEILAAG